jgi:hypothetical protein
MNEQTVETRGRVFSRALLLYGLYTLLNSAFFLIGYYLLPEGLMRGGPLSATGKVASFPGTFCPEFALTLLFNIGSTSTLAVVLNFNRMKGVPAGYIVPSRRPRILLLSVGLLGASRCAQHGRNVPRA